MKIYVMSDIHGNIDAFRKNLELIDMKNENNKLILLGDYLDRNNYEDIRVLKVIIELQKKYNTRVVALMGNHEIYLLEDYQNKKIFVEPEIINWVKTLPYYYETENQIFVHAGIDEEAGDCWKYGVEDYYFCNKYPHTTGSFSKDIIAGHISAYEIAKQENSPIEKGEIYHDNKSHYYIDGDTENTKVIPMLVYDVKNKKYEMKKI